MKRVMLAFALLVFFSSMVQAQESPVRAFPGTVHNRGETRILYWDGAASKAVAEVAISYGRPEWKPEYNTPGALDQMTTGKTWRTGKNFWTFLDTNVPLKIGGQDVAVGMYYLVVQRSGDGKDWSLALLNPSDVRKVRMDAAEIVNRIGEVPVVVSAPLMFEQQSDTTINLEMVLTQYPSDMSRALFQLKWGKFALSAPVEVNMN